MWAKLGGILRDKREENMVIVGGIMREKMAEKKVIVWSKLRGHNEGQD